MSITAILLLITLAAVCGFLFAAGIASLSNEVCSSKAEIYILVGIILFVLAVSNALTLAVSI